MHTGQLAICCPLYSPRLHTPALSTAHTHITQGLVQRSKNQEPIYFTPQQWRSTQVYATARSLESMSKFASSVQFMYSFIHAPSLFPCFSRTKKTYLNIFLRSPGVTSWFSFSSTPTHGRTKHFPNERCEP